MEKDRLYFYKTNTYKIIGECHMKDSEKNWIEAVRYVDINSDYKGEFVRAKEQFENRFIPAVLRVGDKVIISHGKFVGVTEVVDEMEEFVSLKQSIRGCSENLNKRGEQTRLHHDASSLGILHIQRNNLQCETDRVQMIRFFIGGI